MNSKSNITGLILAGGAGRRVGQRDKGLILFNGKPLIAHVCEIIAPQVGTLLISCNRNLRQYENFASQVVVDKREDFQGPLAGLEAASPHILTSIVVIVSCDMPHLPANLVTRLVAPLAERKQGAPEISYVHDGVRGQYLCAAIQRETLFSLPRFLDDGNRAVRDWYTSRNAATVDFSDCMESFMNYNKLT